MGIFDKLRGKKTDANKTQTPKGGKKDSHAGHGHGPGEDHHHGHDGHDHSH